MNTFTTVLVVVVAAAVLFTAYGLIRPRRSARAEGGARQIAPGESIGMAANQQSPDYFTDSHA